MCTCSSNAEAYAGGTVPPAPLTAPEWSSKEAICVDSCIADAMQTLWSHGIVTAGCCCGHNREAPSVVLDNSTSPEDGQRAVALLREFDSRNWVVKQWRLVTL